jgi:hypothetical protein
VSPEHAAVPGKVMVNWLLDAPDVGATLVTLSAHAALARVHPPTTTNPMAAATAIRFRCGRDPAACTMLRLSSIAGGSGHPARLDLTVPSTKETRAPSDAPVS